MLHNQLPVRRWKQWLALPVLGGLFFAANQVASAQPTPTGDPAATRLARHEVIKRKTQAAMHQDSLRTGGKFEPGIAQQVTISNRQGQPEDVTVTVTRVKAPTPTIIVEKEQAPPTPAPPTPYAKGKAPAPVISNGEHVYTYVEQMPALPTGGGVQAIIEQIQTNFVHPAGVPQQGRAFASFVVGATGEVRDAKIIKGLTPAYDEALLAAIQKLPRFIPGQQGGRPVAVSFTVPMLFK